MPRSSSLLRPLGWLALVQIHCLCEHRSLGNPRFEYNAITCLMADIIVGCFVPNLIPRDIVTRKAILLTNMMSMHSVTFRYRSIIVCGTSCHSITTCCLLRRTCFSCNDCTLVPNISSAAMISFVVTVQFFNRFSFTMCRKSLDNL